MRWANPYWLLAAAAAALGALALRRALERRGAALEYPDSRAWAPLAGSGLPRSLPYLLKAASLVLALAALARPQRMGAQVPDDARGIDILLALDTSLSMRALDFDPLDRMAAAKESAARFIRARPWDRLGLVVFGGSPLLGCPLTLDHDSLLGFVSEVQAGMTGTDGTAVGEGLTFGVDRLKDGPARSKVLILITDGANNAGVVDPLTAAQTAKAFGIKIYAIGTGKRGPALLPVDDPVFGRRMVRIPDELDEDALLKIAAATGGRYFRATELKRLREIYAEIDALEKDERSAPPRARYRDLHAWLLGPAALLLAGQMLLARTLWLRLP